MMNELIKVTTNENEEQVVSGRELHQFLEIETPYKKWFDRMTEYGFEENVDFTVLSKKIHDATAFGGIRKLIDHALKIEMAKEICMIQRNDKGKLARQYFLEVERAWNNPEMILERGRKILEKRVNRLLLENETLEIALNDSLKFYTVAKYNKVFKMGWQLKKCQRMGKAMSAFCRSHAIEIRKCETNDERFGTTNSYPLTAWEGFLGGQSE